MAWQGTGVIDHRSYLKKWTGEGVPADSFTGVGLQQSPGPDEWVGRGKQPGQELQQDWRGRGTAEDGSTVGIDEVYTPWAGAGIDASINIRSTSLITRLDEKVEDTDPDNYIWGRTFKYKMLSEAQLEVANMLANNYLTEMQDVAKGLNIAGGSVALSLISSEILGGSGGIADVRVTPANKAPVWADPISMNDLKVYLEPGGFRSAADDRAKYYIWGDKIHVLIDSYSYNPGYGTIKYAKADVYYVRIPPDITNTVAPVLAENLHGILLDWAAFKIFKMDEDGRADSHKQDALGQIKVLNERVSA